MTRYSNHLLSLLFVVIVFGAVLFSQASQQGSSLVTDLSNTESYLVSQTEPARTELVATLLPLTEAAEVNDSMVRQNSPQATLTTSNPRSDIQIQAASWLLSDLSSGEHLGLTNPEQRWPLASLSKLMTAVVALENLGGDREVTISSSAATVYGNANFAVGEKFSVNDLIKAMMTASSNTAAVALAELLENEGVNFAQAMSAKAIELNMYQTSFFDPSGLNLANQSTTPDIEKLVIYIYRFHPEIIKWGALKTVTLTELNSRLKKTLTSINQLAGQSDFIGGKTGYLDEANGNLVSLFKYEGRIILIVVLGAEDRFGETQKIYDWYQENYQLLISNY